MQAAERAPIQAISVLDAADYPGGAFPRQAGEIWTAAPVRPNEDVEIAFPRYVVRRTPFKVELTFHRTSNFFQPGDRRGARLLSPAQIAPPVALTECPNQGADRSIACVEAVAQKRSLRTGWSIEPSDQSMLELIVDFGRRHVANPDREGANLLGFIGSDLAVIVDHSMIVATRDNPLASTGQVSLDFEQRRVTIKSLPVVNPLGLTRLGESVSQLVFSFVGFLVGSGLFWRFVGQSRLGGR